MKKIVFHIIHDDLMNCAFAQQKTVAQTPPFITAAKTSAA
jgi:hypothetical protein